eukprot:CAMPEP_0171093200 /NCGR_PEP_ID=MMETSP0766_2-20121228/38938_1 /TAXON_ID=439317 /ORGANISM="Gambierdiscus australes, Strain CAWD 149" /LENGTH=83 /DNA_ID=CAMNT_0011551605 /DNA_START=970 /DNA_END=1218 /DNA_ORIENTATION=+
MERKSAHTQRLWNTVCQQHRNVAFALGTSGAATNTAKERAGHPAHTSRVTAGLSPQSVRMALPMAPASAQARAECARAGWGLE